MAWIVAVTNVGKALLNTYAAGSHTLAITEATVGSGTVQDSDLPAQTAVASEEDNASIIESIAVTGGVKYKVQVGAAATTAYTAHQIGLWAKLDGGAKTLLLLAQDDDGVSIPTKATFPSFAFSLYITLAVDNTDDLEVTIDETAFVTTGTFNAGMAGKMPLDIGGLSGLSGNPATGDKLVMTRNGDTYKIDYDALAAAIINELGGDPVTVAHGGTGGVTPAQAKANLGFGTAAMNPYISSGAAATVAFVLAATVDNANNTQLYGDTVALVLNNAGFSLYNVSDNVAVWGLNVPVTIAQGGTGANTAAAARNNLSVPYGSYADDTTWANLWANHLSHISQNGHAILLLSSDAASVLSNSKINGFIAAVVFRSGGGASWTFRVMAISSRGGDIYSWIITEATPTSRTTGTVYHYTGTEI